MNKKVIDHLIITLKSYLSFQDIGLLAELEENTKWVPNFALEKKIWREEKELRKLAVENAKEKGKEEGRKEEKIAMVKAFKKKTLILKSFLKLPGL